MEALLLAECLISGFWEEGLLLEDGEEGHRLLKHVDALLEIHPKVDVAPVQSLPHILLLLEGEPEMTNKSPAHFFESWNPHVLVEKLLKLLIDVVDADLFKAVIVEDLKAGDIEDTDVGDLLHCGVDQGLVTFVHNDSVREYYN